MKNAVRRFGYIGEYLMQWLSVCRKPLKESDSIQISVLWRCQARMWMLFLSLFCFVPSFFAQSFLLHTLLFVSIKHSNWFPKKAQHTNERKNMHAATIKNMRSQLTRNSTATTFALARSLVNGAALWEKPFSFNCMGPSINRLICSFNEFGDCDRKFIGESIKMRCVT